MSTLEEAIKHAEEAANDYEEMIGDYALDSEKLAKCAKNQRQIAAWLRELQRARILLRATHDILEAADDSPYVENVLGILVHYDEMDCDGSCLMEDIEYYFEEFGAERRTDD